MKGASAEHMERMGVKSTKVFWQVFVVIASPERSQ